MRQSLKKILGTAALGMALLTTAIPTWAGQVNPQEVYMGSGTGYRYAG